MPRRSNVTSWENEAGVRRNRATPGPPRRAPAGTGRYPRCAATAAMERGAAAAAPDRPIACPAASTVCWLVTRALLTGNGPDHGHHKHRQRKAGGLPSGREPGALVPGGGCPVVGGEDDEATGSRRAVPQAVQLPGCDRGHKGSPSRRSAHEGRVVKAEAVGHHRLGVRLSCRRDGSPGYFRSSSCSNPRRPGSPRRAPRRLA